MKVNYSILLFFLFFELIHAQDMLPGFALVPVNDDLENITAFTFVDGDTILMAKQSGEIFLIENEVLVQEPIVRIPTALAATGGDRGLVAIAIDPDYPVSPYIYVTYTVENATHNRISRFQFLDSDIELSTEEVLLDLSPIPNRWHTGGAIVLDNQGHLFSSVGDNSNPNRAQLMNWTHGKIIRINKDGTIPTDNPFYQGNGEVEDVIWALGLRNPYTMAIEKNTNKIFVNDVGQHEWEEVNDISEGGRNFGWPLEEGFNSSSESTFDEPSYAYTHSDTPSDRLGNAITGGAFYNPTVSPYPAEFINKYFFIDLANKWINHITPEYDGHGHIHDLTPTRETFASDLPKGGIYLTMSPDGFLYFFSREENILYKIDFYDGNEPIILSQPEDTTTMVGGYTRFQVYASGAEELIYDWYKDGNLINRSVNSPLYAFPDTQIGRAADYQIKVSNDYGEVWSDVFTLTVIPFNEAPTVVVNVTSPINGEMYQAGEYVDFEATATDPDIAVIPDENFVWFVELYHDNHIHDAPAFATGVKSGVFQIPDIGETSSNVWYRFIAKVSDDIGQVSENYDEIFPLTSNVTFTTNPPNLLINIDGPSVSTPLTENFVEHIKLPVGAPAYQTITGIDAIYRLSHWSESVVNDLYTVPDDDIEITAVFSECTYPDDIPSLNFQENSDDVLFEWSATNLPCNQRFVLENLNSGETFDVLAYREISDYNYLVNNLDQGVEYQFRIQAINEYGASNYTYVTFTLGIESFEVFNNVQIVPNPTSGDFAISGLNENESFSVKMHSVIGEIIMDLPHIKPTENGKIEFNLSKLSNGIYFLNLSLKNSNKIFKIIKN